MSNLILTIIHDYDYPFVEPFFKSLKEINYKGDLAIFVSDTVSKSTRAAMKKTPAIFIDYQSAFPFKSEYVETFKNIDPRVSIVNYRFIFYLQYLRDHPGKYQKVMLTDVRDVIFQKDPFAELKPDEINFFLEDSSQTFKNSELNYNWSLRANGKEITEAMLNETVSCAGVTLGGIEPMLDYLQYMKTSLEFRTELPWSVDQALHNAYIYHIKPNKMRVVANDGAVVSTLGAYQPYKVNENGQVINSQGKVYAVVHQYDRSGLLFAKIKSKYIGNRLVQKMKRLYFMFMP